MKRTLLIIAFCFAAFALGKANNLTDTRSFPGGGSITVSYNRNQGEITIFAETNMDIKFIEELKITINCTKRFKQRAGLISREKRNTIAPHSAWESAPYEVSNTYNRIPVNKRITTNRGVGNEKIPQDTENEYYENFSIKINSVTPARTSDNTASTSTSVPSPSRTVTPRPQKNTTTPSASTDSAKKKDNSSTNNSENNSNFNSNSDSTSEPKTDVKRDSVSNNDYGHHYHRRPPYHHPHQDNRQKQENLEDKTIRDVENSSNNNKAYITNPDATSNHLGNLTIKVNFTRSAAEPINVLVQLIDGDKRKNKSITCRKGAGSITFSFDDLKENHTYSATIFHAIAQP